MNTCDYDVVIVGGGPAGGVAAHRLADQGMRVLVLEKEKLPRYKPCGGGLTAKAVTSIGIDVSDAYEMPMKKALISYCNTDRLFVECKESIGWMVMRSKLDWLILQQAAKAGASIVDSASVTAVTEEDEFCVVTDRNGNRFKAAVVVGADGVNSVVARSVGLRRNKHVGVAYAGEIFVSDLSMQKQRYAQFDFGCVSKGYAWIFPKKDHLSIGVFSTRRRVPDLKETLFKFIRSHELLKDYEKLDTYGHLIPLGGVYEPLNTERVLLVGDAAGLVDPFWGEGIYFAARSASLASEAIAEYLDKGVSIGSYTAAVHREVVMDLRYSRLFASLFYSLPRLCYRIMVKNPRVSASMARLMRGDISYRGYVMRMFGLLTRKKSPGC